MPAFWALSFTLDASHIFLLPQAFFGEYKSSTSPRTMHRTTFSYLIRACPEGSGYLYIHEVKNCPKWLLSDQLQNLDCGEIQSNILSQHFWVELCVGALSELAQRSSTQCIPAAHSLSDYTHNPLPPRYTSFFLIILVGLEKSATGYQTWLGFQLHRVSLSLYIPSWGQSYSLCTPLKVKVRQESLIPNFLTKLILLGI